jgi:hypothetical protein
MPAAGAEVKTSQGRGERCGAAGVGTRGGSRRSAAPSPAAADGVDLSPRGEVSHTRPHLAQASTPGGSHARPSGVVRREGHAGQARARGPGGTGAGAWARWDRRRRVGQVGQAQVRGPGGQAQARGPGGAGRRRVGQVGAGAGAWVRWGGARERGSGGAGAGARVRWGGRGRVGRWGRARARGVALRRRDLRPPPLPSGRGRRVCAAGEGAPLLLDPPVRPDSAREQIRGDPPERVFSAPVTYVTMRGSGWGRR